MAKHDAVGALPVNWHFIGHLQTNKVRHVVPRVVLVHSVDSTRLAAALDREAANVGREELLGVLLQVNLAREPQKFGCAAGEAPDVARAIATLPRLALRGLMAMAPYEADEAEQRRVFGGLRGLRDRLGEEGLAMKELSMGMSGDFEIAVEEGATILRLGTVLFGERST
jgi:pyridoxal phosphate enzyme (YggS family)